MIVQDVDIQDAYTNCSEDGEHQAVWIHVEIGDCTEPQFDLCEEHAKELRDKLTKALERI